MTFGNPSACWRPASSGSTVLAVFCACDSYVCVVRQQIHPGRQVRAECHSDSVLYKKAISDGK